MLAGAFVLAAASAEFHVAPGGSDVGPGTSVKPYATLQHAQDAARAARAKGENVSVVLHAGIYRLEKTLEFGAADSGRTEEPVIWKAAPGEIVRSW